MGRLTKRIIDEVILSDIGTSDCKKICDSMDEFDHPCDMCPINEAFKKLAHYEDLEEQGRLIELPCAVGDTVYFITQNAEGEYIIGSGQFSYSWLDYPRIIYTTKEEAEAKLKELEG